MELNGAEPWRVLVTRPEPGASATARVLRGQGFQPVLLPLSQTVPLPNPQPAAERFDAVAATSAHALRHADPALLAAVQALPFFAVGEKTAAAARRAGFADVSRGEGDAAGLARLLLSGAGRSVLYLCGRVRRPEFEAALEEGGIAVLAVETYDTEAARPSVERIAQAFGGKPVQAVLLYSVLAAQGYTGLRGDRTAGPLLRDALPLALSRRVLLALPPPQDGFAADQPNEAALLALLTRCRGRGASFQPLRVC